MASSIILVSVLVLFLSIYRVECAATIPQSEIKESKEIFKDVLSDVKDNEVASDIAKTGRKLARAIRREEGCKVDVCFAVEGAKWIKPPTFEMQKLFVALTSTLVGLDADASVAAVQYGRITTAITPNSQNRTDVVIDVIDSEQAKTGDANLSAGLGYCWSQVRRGKNGRKVIVVLGSGRATIGFPAKIVLDVIKKENGVVLNVLTTGQKKDFVKGFGSKPRDIMEIRELSDVSEVMKTTLEDLCLLEGLDAFFK